MYAIQDEFPAYGYRRITAQLRAESVLVNRKRVARLMRLHGMQVRPRRRYVATTESDHDGPIFPNLAKVMAPDGPDRLWVADITYVAICFVYLAVILDAWSRRVVGYAFGRTIEARLTLAALEVAIAIRRPPNGCVHHSDRGVSMHPSVIARSWPSTGSWGQWEGDYPELDTPGHHQVAPSSAFGGGAEKCPDLPGGCAQPYRAKSYRLAGITCGRGASRP